MTTTEELRQAVSDDTADVVAPIPPSSAGDVPERSGVRDRSGLIPLAVVLATLSPFLVGAVSIVRRGFPPGALFGDRALLALSSIDAWKAPALLGPYSRFYWHHPGPLYFYVLNAWSVVFGHGTVAIVLGAVAINAVTTVAILVLALRRGGRPLMVWSALLVTAYLVAVDPIPFDIWNPSVTLLPFALVLLLTWSVACRDWWAAPFLALAASFCVQTHVGLAPGVGAAIVFALVVAVVRERRRAAVRSEAERRTVARAALTSVAVALVVWLPPLVEELTSRRGNLSELVSFFGRPGTPHPFRDGVEQTALQATLLVRSVFADVSLRVDAHQGLAIGVACSVVAFAVALVVARRVRATDVVVLLALVVVELLAGVYAVTRIVDDIQFYLVQWISAVGFVLWLALGSAVVEGVRRSGFAWRRPVARIAVAVVVVALCVSAVRAFPGYAGPVNEDLNVPNNRALFGYVPSRQLLAATRAGDTVVLRLDSVTAWEVMAADALLLVQHDRHVVVVETPVTRLLFDDSLLVGRVPPGQVLAFRDRPSRGGPGERLVAEHGAWSIVDTGRR